MLRKAVTTVLLLTLFVLPTTASQEERARVITAESNRCEDNSSYFDLIDTETRGELLIFIARLGDGELNRSLNWRRLHNIREYFTYVREVPAHNVVVAEGEPVKGRGRVEVFAKGRLFAVFTVGRAEDLSGAGCEGGRSWRFYPWRKSPAVPAVRTSSKASG